METIKDYIRHHYSTSILVDGYYILDLIKDMTPSQFEDFMQTEVISSETRSDGQTTMLFLKTR